MGALRVPDDGYCPACGLAPPEHDASCSAQLAAVPEPMTIAEIVEAFESATSTEEIFGLLRETEPPADPIDQQLLRHKLGEVLKRRKISVKVLDAWVKAKAEEAATRTGLSLPEYEPWPEPVDGAELVADLEAYFERFQHAPPESILAASLWTVWTHAFDLFDIAALLLITSPTKRCGKTTLLRLIGEVAPRRLFSSNLTGPSLFRVIERYRPTLLIDEADNFSKLNDDLKGLLNAGHERTTAQAIRTVGDDHEVRTFSTWAPKAFTAIGNLPDTIEDRSLRLVLLRKPQDVRKARARRREIRRAAEGLASRCVRWVEDHAHELRSMEEPDLEALHDRAADNWAPLLMIAALCGDDVRRRAEAAAVVLTVGEEAGLDELLLAHVREAFGDGDRIATADLLASLVDRDDAPWAAWWATDVASEAGLKKAAAALARRLRKFSLDIRSRQMKIDGANVHGYDRAPLEDAWRRWLPDHVSETLRNDATDATDATPALDTPPLTSGNEGGSEGSESSVSPEASKDTHAPDHEGVKEALRAHGPQISVPALGKAMGVAWVNLPRILEELSWGHEAASETVDGVEVWSIREEGE